MRATPNTVLVRNSGLILLATSAISGESSFRALVLCSTGFLLVVGALMRDLDLTRRRLRL